jgi:NarL family two-component system response regulator LiaR
MIRVLIADDHAVVRKGIRGFLETEPDFAVVGEAETTAEAIDKACESRPDVAIVDLVLPGEGVAAVRGIKEASPATKIVVLTALDDASKVVEVFKAGALSYLLKETSPDDLLVALRRAAAGESTLHPLAATRLVENVASREPRLEKDLLTQREFEVLQLLAQGHSNKEIAQMLHIGERTIKAHVSAIFSKFDLADRTSAAALAWRHGWVTSHAPPSAQGRRTPVR